jgi:FtsZ-binding cell division protein ZapB
MTYIMFYGRFAVCQFLNKDNGMKLHLNAIQKINRTGKRTSLSSENNQIKSADKGWQNESIAKIARSLSGLVC